MNLAAKIVHFIDAAKLLSKKDYPKWIMLRFCGFIASAAVCFPGEQGEQEQDEEDKGGVGNGLGGVEALRVKDEVDGVLALGQDDGTQDIVGTQDVRRFTVDGAAPAGVVDV